jgi:MAE_28990/MAE_18760-like HEPN
MSIRTVDDLSNRLDAELAWRKKELSDLKYFIDLSLTDRGRHRVLGRCGITILYAHWEGFIKLASRYYLEFVAMQRLRNDQLQPNLLTLSLRTTVTFSPESHRHSEYGKVTDFFISGLSNHARLPFKTGLETESNLSSTVLKEITWCLGVEYLPYESKEKFIDSRLLARRNHIAHGQEVDVDSNEFEEMCTIVIDMMTYLKTELENSALLRRFAKI